MRQRNISQREVHVSAWPTDEHPDDWPFDVGVNEEIDFHQLLGGFEEVPDVQDVPVKRKGKDAAVAAVPEEGEPQ